MPYKQTKYIYIFYFFILKKKQMHFKSQTAILTRKISIIFFSPDRAALQHTWDDFITVYLLYRLNAVFRLFSMCSLTLSSLPGSVPTPSFQSMAPYTSNSGAAVLGPDDSITPAHS